MSGVELIRAINGLNPADRLLIDLLIARLQASDQVLYHLQVFVRQFGEPRSELVDFQINPDAFDNQ